MPPSSAASAETPSAETPSANTTGRRSSLARWLTRAEHPLTPRVMANRLWHHHLGRGIVGTPNDFGFQGEAPTHLALLDWLATEFVESGWSLKHLHRLIVTSSTYCQSSAVRPDDPHHARALEVDGENRFLWHARRRRLEGEAIRDTMLFVSGAMTHRLHGPSVRPKLPDGISKRYAWKPDGRQENHYRRSIYVFVKRNMRFPLFDTFDWPDLHNSCASRSHTTTPPQALLMLNSELTLDLARRWAEKLVARSGDEPRALVTAAYEAAFGRPPGADELELALAFLGRSGLGRSGGIAGAGASGGGELAVEAVHDLCHALFNASEFIYVD
ncbi:MAG: DUF1553 domain-containing protein [Planctomycetota bacterium]|nr:DUF1553 domain-containing protein [Planctomycetota bacterium]